MVQNRNSHKIGVLLIIVGEKKLVKTDRLRAN